MPSLLTHYLCGDTAFKIIDNEKIRELLKRNRHSYNLGTQGPDIFFYYGAWPWSANKGFSNLGNLMHDEKTGSFFEEACSYVRSSGSGTLVAYLMGFICHYILDTQTHPYIFYKTGFARNSEESDAKFSSYHRMFETILDILMSSHILGKAPHEIKAWKLIKIDSQESDEISKLYTNVLKSVYEIDINIKEINTAISDIAGISRALRDRTGLKRNIIRYIESKTNKNPLISSMIHPLKLDDSLDYLNLKNTDWYYPWDNQEAHSTSFIDMFDKACHDSVKIFEALYDFLFGRTDIITLMDMIGSRSYSSGVDCTIPLKFKYYDCIFENSDTARDKF